MLNTLFDTDDYFDSPFHSPDYNGVHLSPFQVTGLRREEQRKLAYRQRMEEEARRRRAAEMAYRRNLERERELAERFRARQKLYEEEERQAKRLSEEEDMNIDEVASSSGDNQYEENSRYLEDKEMESPYDSGGEKTANLGGVVVEDASDSECEDEVLNSPWRNRRPSPGQWMEPIAYYYQ